MAHPEGARCLIEAASVLFLTFTDAWFFLFTFLVFFFPTSSRRFRFVCEAKLLEMLGFPSFLSGYSGARLHSFVLPLPVTPSCYPPKFVEVRLLVCRCLGVEISFPFPLDRPGSIAAALSDFPTLRRLFSSIFSRRANLSVQMRCVPKADSSILPWFFSPPRCRPSCLRWRLCFLLLGMVLSNRKESIFLRASLRFFLPFLVKGALVFFVFIHTLFCDRHRPFLRAGPFEFRPLKAHFRPSSGCFAFLHRKKEILCSLRFHF